MDLCRMFFLTPYSLAGYFFLKLSSPPPPPLPLLRSKMVGPRNRALKSVRSCSVRRFTVPYFFSEIIEIEHVALILWVAILDEGKIHLGGRGWFERRGKNVEAVLTSLQLALRGHDRDFYPFFFNKLRFQWKLCQTHLASIFSCLQTSPTQFRNSISYKQLLGHSPD